MNKVDSFEEIAAGYLLYTIEDVDDIVLRFGYMAIDDFPNLIERKYFYFEIVGSSGEIIEMELTKEEHENETFFPSYTKLNYQEFLGEMNTTQFYLFLRDKYLMDEYNEFFRPQSITYINSAAYEGLMKVRLKEVIQNISFAYYELKNISFGWHHSVPLNDIQKTVISLFMDSYLSIKETLIDYYKDIVPEIIKEFKDDNFLNQVKLKKAPIWYKLALVIAEGRIAYEKRGNSKQMEFYLDNEKMETPLKLAERISAQLKEKPNSIRPYIANTFITRPKENSSNYNKNVFSRSHLKDLIDIKSNFNNENIDPFFLSSLEELEKEYG